MTKISVTWVDDWSRGRAGDRADLILATAQGAADGWAKYIQGDSTIDFTIGIGNVGGGNFLANGGPNGTWDRRFYAAIQRRARAGTGTAGSRRGG